MGAILFLVAIGFLCRYAAREEPKSDYHSVDLGWFR